MRKPKEDFGDMSISKKLYLTILACLILPLILVFCLMNSVIGKKFRENQCEKELEVLKQSKQGIVSVLNDTEMISRSLIGSKDVQSLFDEYIRIHTVNEKTGVDLNLYIREFMGTRSYLSSISLYRNDNILFQCGNYYEKEGTDEVTGLREALDEKGGAPVWEAARLHPYFAAGDQNEWIVSLQRNINHLYRMETLGTERISIKEDYLCSLYEPLELSEDSVLYIFDHSGKVVSATDKNMLGTKVSSDVKQDISSEEGYYLDEVTKTAVFYYKIPLNGWTVVKESDIGLVNSQISIINVVIWISLILSLLFGFIFSCLQKKSIINPIIKLSQAAELVNGENFTISLYTQNKDEVGMLNRNIMQMTARISELIDTVYKEEIRMKEAEILSLQSQINPHFLYNTLDTLRWQAIENEEDELAAQIEALSNLFRHVLNKGKETTTVRDEMDHLRNYLAIQKGRFGDRIQVETKADESLYSCEVIKLILQPLVENAFVHGLEKKVGKGAVHVSIKETEGAIVYCVEDNGVGTDEVRINRMLDSDESPGELFALKNVNERIRLKYGNAYGLTFRSKVGLGTIVKVRMPRIEMEEEHESIDSR